MTQNQFQKYNIVAGWATFLVALITYSLSVEPTLSFWDCGEYIATSAKLEVGHPPGAPFFQIMGAFFASFASSPEKIALMVNYMSVFSSAFTILFLYFIIVNLTSKFAFKSSEEIQFDKAIAVISSGVIGGLTFTFSDSFWFNAVEAEVYAMAMLFMSGMFWLGIKWTDNLHSPRGNKWLLAIALVFGLSFGVHFMALLTIPAIGMLYFFNSNHKKNLKNFLIANIISVAILLVFFKLVLPSTLAFFGETEVFFVNVLELPFNSGTIFAGLLLVAFFVGIFRFSHRKKYYRLQMIALCLLFVFVGFSSWLMIPIRANANTVINENSPTDARLLLAYYNLEQYPKTHLFFGPMYSDNYASSFNYEDEKPKYERDYKKGKYIIVNRYKNAIPSPNKKHLGILPRMWNPAHAVNYMAITEPLQFKLAPRYAHNPEAQKMVFDVKQKLQNGELSLEEYEQFLNQYKSVLEVEKPSFFQNLKFLFSYQINYMYVRYFMWNFAGRQDDIQGKMDNHGNWLSGIDFIDELHLGLSQKNLPSDVLNNKARNTYFFLPLLLGLIGLGYHYRRSPQKWWVVMMLFLFTGLALKVYVNERPFEPRERDYALVGSFLSFSIWIGIGVYAIFDFVRKKLNPNFQKWATLVAIPLLFVPLRMATQNFDDHSRADKYSARAIAKNYLDSVDKDKGAMLFSIGDNDTFSFWYMQEVEGYRTDVRIINTSLLATDWYIDQMKRKAYNSEPIPSQLTHDKYAYGVNNAIYYSAKSDKIWSVKDLINWIESNDEKTKIAYEIAGEEVLFPSYPTHKIRVPVNKENVLKSGVVKPQDAHLIVDYIDIELPKSGFGKNRLLMLDILANNNWERPIYFTGGSMSNEEYIWMKDYLQLDGLVYKLVPIKTPQNPKSPYDLGRIDSDLMYNIATKWEWGNMDKTHIYHDIETRRNSIIFRSNLARLSEVLIQERKLQKAEQILDLAHDKFPLDFYGHYFTTEPIIEGYYKVNQKEKARKLFSKVAKKYQEYLNYYLGLPSWQLHSVSDEMQFNLKRYGTLIFLLSENDDDFYDVEKEKFERYLKLFYQLIGVDYPNEENQEIQDNSVPDSFSEEKSTILE